MIQYKLSQVYLFFQITDFPWKLQNLIIGNGISLTRHGCESGMFWHSWHWLVVMRTSYFQTLTFKVYAIEGNSLCCFINWSEFQKCKVFVQIHLKCKGIHIKNRAMNDLISILCESRQQWCDDNGMIWTHLTSKHRIASSLCKTCKMHLLIEELHHLFLCYTKWYITHIKAAGLSGDGGANNRNWLWHSGYSLRHGRNYCRCWKHLTSTWRSYQGYSDIGWDLPSSWNKQ